MRILNLVQGTPEWVAHRAQHFNASDAPAMMGCSPYKARAQLIREVATGITPDIDAATQRRFDDGHRFEELARPLAEEIIGEDLYPCVGISDHDPRLSASFDGLTLGEDTAFEHKSINDDLRACMRDQGNGFDLPKHYRVQMEQQLMVSGAERVLFMASKWAGEDLVEERHCWYASDPDLRAEILAGWEQFAADVAAYQPEPPPAPAAVGRAPDQLPALSVIARGMVEHSNHLEFRERALTAIAAVNRDLQTDDDFATAELTVKAFKSGEDMLEATRQQILGQMADVNEVMRTIDEVQAELRRVRLDLDKLVTREKDSRKSEIVQAGVDAVRQHYASINTTMGEHAIQVPATVQSLIGAAIKGKRTIATIRDAADQAVAQAKIDASQVAERVRACVAVLGEFEGHGHLFADRVQLCAVKAPEDLRNLAAARVAEHQQREAERLERERERIRREEADRLEREQRAQREALERQQQEEADLAARQQAEARQQVATAAADSSHGTATSGGVPHSGEVPDRVWQMTGSGSHVQGEGTPGAGGLATAAAAPAAQITLGEIKEWIAPLSIDAAGLASLGFKPAATKGAAKLYAGEDFPHICGALARLIAEAPARAARKEAA